MRRTPKPEPRVRTLFFGTSAFAVPSLRALAQKTSLAGVVTQPDRPAGRGQKLTPTPVKAAALELGIPVYEPQSLKSFARDRETDSYDLFALASYGKILPASVLAMPKLGALNVHPSMLPKYRGATPLQTALRNGDTQTGVTIMLMDAGMDTGPVVLQEAAPIAPDDTYGTLHDRLAELGATLLVRAVERAERGELAAVAQTGEPSVTAPLRKEDLHVAWSWTAERIVNAVRALSPAPAARAELLGVPIKILSAQTHPADDALAVPCGGGTVYLTRVIAPGKDAMSGRAFEQYAQAAAR